MAARTLNATGPPRVTLSRWQGLLRAGCGPRQEESGPEIRPKTTRAGSAELLAAGYHALNATGGGSAGTIALGGLGGWCELELDSASGRLASLRDTVSGELWAARPGAGLGAGLQNLGVENGF